MANVVCNFVVMLKYFLSYYLNYSNTAKIIT